MTTKTEQKTLRFLLLRGMHSFCSRKLGTYRLYEPGDIVESETNLAERFGRNKFQLLLREKGK
jgi:hypothetical protein